jgi:RNA polymerase sigma-70 factor (ECF subfamily)
LALKDHIRAAKNGDQQAFKYLLEKYWNDVYRFQLSQIDNASEAEDITIETFAKAFEKIHTYKEKYSFKNWLLTISKNTYTDRFRKKKRQKDTLSLDNEKDYKKDKILNIPDDNSEEDRLILEQKLNKIQKALSKLKPKYREILKLRYFDEMSYKEIAEKTGESISNVKVRLMRAKKLLAQQINNDEDAN